MPVLRMIATESHLARQILRRHGYPPDEQEAATDLAIEQAEVMGSAWTA